MVKSIIEMDKNELLDYLKENPDEFKSLYTKENISKINWDYIPEKLIDKNEAILENFDWDYISACQKLSESFIAKHKRWVWWYYISKYQKLSENFIAEHKDLVDWYYISEYQKLSESFITKYKDLVDWIPISRYQKLSENFIAEHKDLVAWHSISMLQKLSESFIAKYKDLVDWYCISEYQNLSEEFIEKHKDLVIWCYISKYQKLSEAFITKHKDLVDWNCISAYQKLSEEFIKKYKDYIDIYLVNDNWLNKSTEFKKEAVVKTGKYECHKDYFIAYKGIRSDRYSKFNFQYQYMPGETYECFSDGSDNEGSFGLSVWTEEKAAGYCNELVVRCKIYYEDVTRVVHDDYKIRCSKITILD